jgi:hypothetical protein
MFFRRFRLSAGHLKKVLPGFSTAQDSTSSLIAVGLLSLCGLMQDFTEQLHLDRLHPVHAGLWRPGWFSYGLGSSRKNSGDDYPKCRLARRGPLSSLGSSAVILAGQAGS